MSISKKLHIAKNSLDSQSRKIHTSSNEFLKVKQKINTQLAFKHSMETHNLTLGMISLMGLLTPSVKLNPNFPSVENLAPTTGKTATPFKDTVYCIKTAMLENQAWISQWLAEAKTNTTDFLSVATPIIDGLEKQVAESLAYVQSTSPDQLNAYFTDERSATIDIPAQSKLSLLQKIGSALEIMEPIDVKTIASDSNACAQLKEAISRTCVELTPVCGIIVDENGSITVNQQSISDEYSIPTEGITPAELGYTSESYIAILQETAKVVSVLKTILNKIPELIQPFNDAATVANVIVTESLDLVVDSDNGDDTEIDKEVKVIATSRITTSTGNVMDPTINTTTKVGGNSRILDIKPQSTTIQNTTKVGNDSRILDVKTESIDNTLPYPGDDKGDIENIDKTATGVATSKLNSSIDPVTGFDNKKISKDAESRLNDNATKEKEFSDTTVAGSDNKLVKMENENLHITEDYTTVQNGDIVNSYMLIIETLVSAAINNIISVLSIVKI